jgi:hypothetical protein
VEKNLKLQNSIESKLNELKILYKRFGGTGVVGINYKRKIFWKNNSFER